MNDTQRIDFLDRTGASIVGLTHDNLIPTQHSVIVGRITGWHHAPNIRDAIDACELEYRTVTMKDGAP